MREYEVSDQAEINPLMSSGKGVAHEGGDKLSPPPGPGAMNRSVHRTLEQEPEEHQRFYSVETLSRNFYSLAMAFSLSHGCATSCLAYATTLLGSRLGAISSGVLFALYALSSFFISKPIVTYMGSKNGLILGVIGYAVYVCGFAFATLVVRSAPGLAWFVCIVCSIVGGVAGGVLWTSQGLYFSRHAYLYSQSTGQQMEKVTAEFSAIFAVVLLSVEMVTKLASSVWFAMLDLYGAEGTVLFYAVVVCLSCLVIFRIKSLDEKGTWDLSYQAVSRDVGAVARVVWTDSRLLMLLPFQMSFGYVEGYIPYYIFGTVVSESPTLGFGAVGLFSALVVFVGALVSIPAASLAKQWGKERVIVASAISFGCVAIPIFLFKNETIGTWFFMSVLMVLYGAGRGVWETINKAVLVDFFAEEGFDKTAAAFSAASFATGYAQGLGFFMFSYLSRLQMAGLVLILAILGVTMYQLAFLLQDRRKEIQQKNKAAQDKVDAIRREGQNSRRLKKQQQVLEGGDDCTTSMLDDYDGINQTVTSSQSRRPKSRDGRSGSGRASPLTYGNQFAMGQGGISLISGNGRSGEEFVNAFTSVSNFARSVGGASRKKRAVPPKQNQSQKDKQRRKELDLEYGLGESESESESDDSASGGEGGSDSDDMQSVSMDSVDDPRKRNVEI